MEASSNTQNELRSQHGVGSKPRVNFDGQVVLDWDFELSNPQDEAGLNEAVGSYEPDDPISSELVETLSSILHNEGQRKTLCDMTGNSAQVMIDYLNSVLLKPVLPKPWLRRHSLIALYKLCKRTQLYPQCYVLKDLIVSSDCEAFGGFSDIFKGKFGEKELCLKMVRLNRSNMDAMLKRYAKEAILWGQLNHPNITPLYGIYRLDSARHQLCLVSPWMCHGDIVRYLELNKLVPRTPFVYDVASGLGYLHERGFIHSDLKGANVLVNDRHEACLTDFGMSFIRTDKTLGHAMTTTAVHGFTQRWASPELLDEDARPTMASDVWALACVFYEILTDRLPFDHLKTDLQIAGALLKGKIPTRQPLMSNATEKVIWPLIERCWVQEPSERLTCREILSELHSAGISRPRDHNVQRNAEHETRSLKDAMCANRDGYVNVDIVKEILSGLVTSSNGSRSDSRGPTPDASEHYDVNDQSIDYAKLTPDEWTYSPRTMQQESHVMSEEVASLKAEGIAARVPSQYYPSPIPNIHQSYPAPLPPYPSASSPHTSVSSPYPSSPSSYNRPQNQPPQSSYWGNVRGSAPLPVYEEHHSAYGQPIVNSAELLSETSDLSDGLDERFPGVGALTNLEAQSRKMVTVSQPLSRLERRAERVRRRAERDANATSLAQSNAFSRQTPSTQNFWYTQTSPPAPPVPNMTTKPLQPQSALPYINITPSSSHNLNSIQPPPVPLNSRPQLSQWPQPSWPPAEWRVDVQPPSSSSSSDYSSDSLNTGALPRPAPTLRKPTSNFDNQGSSSLQATSLTSGRASNYPVMPSLRQTSPVSTLTTSTSGPGRIPSPVDVFAGLKPLYDDSNAPTIEKKKKKFLERIGLKKPRVIRASQQDERGRPVGSRAELAVIKRPPWFIWSEDRRVHADVRALIRACVGSSDESVVKWLEACPLTLLCLFARQFRDGQGWVRKDRDRSPTGAGVRNVPSNANAHLQ